MKTPQEQMELMQLEKGSCAIPGTQSALIQQLQAWALPPGSEGRVGGCSQPTEEDCLSLCSPLWKIGAQQMGWVAGGGRLKLSRWDDQCDPSSRQSVLLPTDLQRVVSMFLGLQKPLQNDRRKVPPHFSVLDLSLFLAPSPALAGPTDPTSQAAQLPEMHLCA